MALWLAWTYFRFCVRVWLTLGYTWKLYESNTWQCRFNVLTSSGLMVPLPVLSPLPVSLQMKGRLNPILLSSSPVYYHWHQLFVGEKLTAVTVCNNITLLLVAIGVYRDLVYGLFSTLKDTAGNPLYDLLPNKWEDHWYPLGMILLLPQTKKGFRRSWIVMEFENAFSRPGITDFWKNDCGHVKVIFTHGISLFRVDWKLETFSLSSSKNTPPPQKKRLCFQNVLVM